MALWERPLVLGDALQPLPLLAGAGAARLGLAEAGRLAELLPLPLPLPPLLDDLFEADLGLALPLLTGIRPAT